MTTRGFTLIELMISLGVLVIGLVAAASTLTYASRASAAGAHVQQGSLLAQNLVTTLLGLPYGANNTSNASLFANTSTTNDADPADSSLVFTQATLPSGAFDHSDAELPAGVAAMLPPATATGITYERYWNVAPMGPNGVVVAAIVRWHEGSSWQRTVVVGTRYAP